MNVEERFWSKVEVQGDCWVWIGGRSTNGYGRFSVVGVYHIAHRWAYTAMVGDIPDGLDLDHLCRNRPCVNPYHLEPVTRSVNLLRGDGPEILRRRNAARTHCKRGHEFTPENIRQRDIGRQCRECERLRRRVAFKRARAA